MSKENSDTPAIPAENLFPVVGIGASAGGLAAFKRFVKAIPQNSGMAYVLVQHLLPEHDSILPEILQRETEIPVQEIKNNLEVEVNTIYIIPSNKILIATDGVLKLSPRPVKDKKNMVIDIFFTSLAEVHHASSIGIALSGTGKDGTAGLKKIKDNGGITFAQDLATAAYTDMPQNAMDEEIVDFVMEPEQMPLQLVKLQRTFKILVPGHLTGTQLNEEENFKALLALLRVRRGVDFAYYKQPTIRRRILRRLGIRKIEKLSAYLEYIKQNKEELDLLFQDLLIPVTNFFRDTSTFDNLCESILPELIKNKGANHTIRIWIAGCSTGEEAYSVGICLQEYLNTSGLNLKVQIFATDISEKSITKARLGLYLKRELEGVSDNRLQQFFNKSDGSYQVKKVIRDMCVFAVHNILKDPPFSLMDFISCRNVLIYMEPQAQKRVLGIFHYALNAKGLLLVGKSETTSISQNLYLPTGKKEKLYAKKAVPGRLMIAATERGEESMRNKDYSLRANERTKEDFQKNVDDILLSRYTPAGLVVNEHFEIVQFRGQTGKFIEPSPGKPSLNVLKMVKEGLSFEVRNALHKAGSTKETFIKENIAINNGKTLITIEVVPLLNTPDPHFLILFRDTSLPAGNKAVGDETLAGAEDTPEKNYVKKLESELAQLREDMRSITEDQEAINEELQSANEELLSGSRQFIRS